MVVLLLLLLLLLLLPLQLLLDYTFCRIIRSSGVP